MNVVLLRYIEKDRPADGVESDLAIVIFPRRLVRKWERNIERFQRLFLLGAISP